jgi:hypothetical protein
MNRIWIPTMVLAVVLGWAVGGVSSTQAQGIENIGQAGGPTNPNPRPVGVDTTPQYPTGPGSRRELCGAPDVRGGTLTIGNQPNNVIALPNLWFVYDSNGNPVGAHQCRVR